MPAWITDSGYVEVETVRSKVGTGRAETPGVALLDLVAHSRRDLDLAALPGLAEDPLADLRARAPAGADPATVSGAAGLRPLAVRRLVWNEEGSRLALQLFSADHKDRWLAVVDPASATLSPLERQSDPAWLGWRFDELGWMRDGATLWFLSEESGWSHLYLRPLGGARRQLTGGAFEVDDPRLARDGKSFLVTANREHPGVEEVYRVDVASGEMARLTQLDGLAQAVPSPDEKQLLVTWSGVASPPELYLQPARAGAAAKRLTHTVSPGFSAVAWTLPEIVAVPSRHGAGEIWSRLYLPPGWTAEKRYPAVVFVHGAGYLQNAHKGWSWYHREFMFHTLLARRGVVVLDMDYRASAGYGRAWRTAIYREMGGPELEDLEDGVAWLAAQKGVDPARVGVYGGSYGGFLTLMALFKQPALFAAGAALRPVTDWAHYADWYAGAILNTPDVDPEAYRRSSPIEHAEGLAKPLLICHGMVDDNVFFQDSVRLVQRLIELGKTEWFETAIYPVEPHAFTEPASWLDEYKRIWRLFERTLPF
jgi:dipeptidyl aminopeptidase/acylaminoacyl peptidase